MTARAPAPRKAFTLRAARRGGFALLVVLFLIVILAVSVAALTVRTSGGYRLAQSRATGWKLYYASRAALEEAKAKLWREAMTPKSVPGILAPPEPMTFDEDGVSVTIYFEDEAGKLAINNFVSGDAAKKKDLVAVLGRLFSDLGIPNAAGLATAAQDFVNEDKEASKDAEAKHAALVDISELVLAKGFSTKALFQPGAPGEAPAADYLTTWYTGSVNINGASALVLKALEPSLTDEDLDRIISVRAVKPFEGAEDLATRSGLPAQTLGALNGRIAFTTDTFTFKIEARQGIFFRRIAAVVWTESSAAHTASIRDGWQAYGG